MKQITIQIGNNIELLKAYPDNTFDSVVTDAPYGLGKEQDMLKVLQDWLDHGYSEISGKGFMGKEWDAFVPQPLFWKEVLRVLKPGGFLLCFFGTRTYDLGTLAIRLAGFEIRDMITWHYGSGFPKSMDVSKAVDKELKTKRKVIGKNRNSRKRTKGSLQRAYLADRSNSDITEASSVEAKSAEGIGTALKPATEPICVARKPFNSNVAKNFISYGTGGINIDACRIEFENEEDFKSATYGTGTNIIGANYVGSKLTDGRKNIEANKEGRFPANVIFDPFTAAILDEQTGVLTSGLKDKAYKSFGTNGIYGTQEGIYQSTCYADSGGASRFFYCAKPSQYERNAGCENIKPKKVDDGREVVCDNAFQRGDTERNNSHPTVKPISLMRWLLRLVTPKGGLSLDTFAGSGTTGCAAEFEEINIVLMEREEEYRPIIVARTAFWQKQANRERYIEELKNSQTSLF